MSDRPRWQRMDTLGMTPGTWARVLRGTPRPVDRSYIRKAAAAVAVGSVSVAGRAWRRVADRARLPAPADIDVVFIVGHWRSGTTHLHHLLSQDADRFVVLPQSMAVFPHLHGTPLLMPVLDFLGIGGSYKRLMDNVVLSPASPMELEFAIWNLTGCSEYLTTTFPRQRHSFLRFLRAHPGDTSSAEDRAWRRAAASVTGRLARSGRTVLHKNPPSTANVLELKQLFPRARFVFLWRDPEAVFVSTVKTWKALTEVGTLQETAHEGLEDYVLRRYVALHRAWLRQRDALPASDRVEARFEDLVADPLALVARIYDTFGWGAVDVGLFADYLAATRSYQRNRYPALNATTAARITAFWGDIALQLDRTPSPRL